LSIYSSVYKITGNADQDREDWGLDVSESRVRVVLRISREEYLRVYQGTARIVHAIGTDGRTIRFPVNILQRFVTHNGIEGEFEICFDHQHKFKSIEKVN